MVKIGFIVPNMDPELSQVISRIAQDMGCEIVLGSGHFGEALDCARQMVAEHPDIQGFIARNNTAAYLRRYMDIPCTNLELTNFDVARTLSKIEDKRGKFLLFQFLGDSISLDVRELAEICRVQLSDFWVTPGKTHDYPALARKMGCQKIITSVSLVAEPCRRAGMEVYLIRIARDEILRSFQRCRINIDLRRREQVKTERFRQSLDTIHDGFVGIDETGRIAVFNHQMELITGIPHQEILGMDKPDAIGRFPFLGDVFSAEDEDILEINDRKYSMARESYMMEGLPLREIIRLVDVPELQKIEENVRKKLSDKGFKAKHTFQSMYYACPSMYQLKEKAQKYALSSSSILITGETGTGKEVLAQSIHNASTFRNGPFVAINCAALPEPLLESELFGYEEGAFTGAKRGGKAGLMELSHQGTLFLDEIGLMPLTFQAKLLRSIQERQICRLGGNRLIPIQNRIICATNRDLLRDVEEGSFREDLYYRINVLMLTIPPLRERGEAVKVMAQRLLLKKCKEARRYIYIPDHLLNLLLTYDWPGNVRQLEGFLERLVVLTEGSAVTETLLTQLLDEMRSRRGPTHVQDAASGALLQLGTLEDIERTAIQQANVLYGGRLEQMTQALGISRTTLWRRMKQYHIADPQMISN